MAELETFILIQSKNDEYFFLGKESKLSQSEPEIVQDVLRMNYLMYTPITQREAERVVRALGLANYEIKKRPPEKSVPRG